MSASPPSLTAEERGFLAGLHCLGAEKTAVDRTLEGGDRLRAAWEALDAQAQDQRVTALADWLSDARAPLPPGIADLDPSWVIEAVAGEAPGLALALVEGVPALVEALAGTLPGRHRSTGEGRLATTGAGAGAATGADVRAATGAGTTAAWALEARTRRELQRLVFGALEPLTGPAAGPEGEALASLERAELLVELTRRGARTVGVSLAGAPLELRARAMATAGAPWSSEIAAAAARPTDPPTRDRARALVARAAAAPAPTPLHRLRAVGLEAVAAALVAEGAGSVLRVAGRLPAELGRALLQRTV